MLIKTFDFGDTDYSSPCTYEMYSGTTLIYSMHMWSKKEGHQ